MKFALVDRSAAARKAWATRRSTADDNRRPDSSRAAALAEFDRHANSECPDWHAAAIALRSALRSVPPKLTIVARRPLPIPAPKWPDYPIEGKPSSIGPQMQWPSPILVVTFADGELVRAPAVSLRGRPVNVGRGLRMAIAFYTARRARRIGLADRPGTRPAVPEVSSCICEDDGHVYDPAECSARTIEYRAAADWKIGRRK